MPGNKPEAAPADDMEDMDPGLARERTELAWIRTAIAFAALGGAILKVNPAVGFPVLATSALVWAIGRVARRIGAARGDRRGLLLMITVAVTLVSLVALVVVLAGVRSPLPSP